MNLQERNNKCTASNEPASGGVSFREQFTGNLESCRSRTLSEISA